MLDSSPFCCQLWDRNLKKIDCNQAAVDLFGFKDKHEHLQKSSNLYPTYQPNGMNSKEMIKELVEKAFDEGYSNFIWTYRLLDGSEMPADITLVRVKYHNDFIIAGYTIDLRQIADMEQQIVYLESEADKIYYDALTGIYNRRFFDEKLNQIIKSLSRTKGKLSLMMIDIDYFKKYNDAYGHSEGDICLKEIAGSISKCITRSDDFVARYGGEEFVVVLPNTEERGARILADRIMMNIKALKIAHIDNEVDDVVTVSIGITTGKVVHPQTNEDYIKQADEMLYISKKDGRNRYTFASM
jgi:diguanylate cyclase (GGDEF)-like protein